MPGIIALLGGTVLKYLAAAGVAVALLGYAVHEIRAPYKREIADLRAAADLKEKLAEADAVRADVAEAELANVQDQLRGLLHDQKPDACRLSSADLDGLRKLAGAKGRSR